jgi:hypothetical protein
LQRAAQQTPDGAALRAKLLQKLPAWAQHPDVEKANWLNELVASLWPNLKKGIEDTVLASVQPMLDDGEKARAR